MQRPSVAGLGALGRAAARGAPLLRLAGGQHGLVVALLDRHRVLRLHDAVDEAVPAQAKPKSSASTPALPHAPSASTPATPHTLTFAGSDRHARHSHPSTTIRLVHAST